ncbi:hypothetical protein NDU88_002678 [Pleurodeles waltl]|uniref:Uncharacterized protein n=1 Tax=Pleurodeles waltl TaxID=8319 RepID=A0AAV7MNG3_PLEWA|nr:hypothetical protein NDU88_002678 [Pleurodeles waltl]
MERGPDAECDGERNPDPERKYLGTVDAIDIDPEEAGAVVKRVYENDVEPREVLNPELDDGGGGSFSPRRRRRGKEGKRDERTGIQAETWKKTMWRRGVNQPEAETAEGVLEERGSGQAGHVLGRTWPSQVRTTAETGHGEAGISFLK